MPTELPIEKVVQIYLCNGAGDADFETVSTLYAQYDISAFVAKSGNQQLEDFFTVNGETHKHNFCFDLEGPKMDNKVADLLYNLAKCSKPTYAARKYLTHHVYVFAKNWKRKPDDTWSDYIKDRFREVSRISSGPHKIIRPLQSAISKK
jgi:hypothetical protein